MLLLVVRRKEGRKEAVRGQKPKRTKAAIRHSLALLFPLPFMSEWKEAARRVLLSVTGNYSLTIQ